MNNSKQAYTNHQSVIPTHKEMIVEVLKRNPDSSRFEVGRLTGLGHLEAQRRLSDLKNDGRVIETGSRKHGNNRVSLYGIKSQLQMFPTNRLSLRKWLENEHPDILFKYDALYNHKL